eukprot:443802-Rhodomonas_salina.2
MAFCTKRRWSPGTATRRLPAATGRERRRAQRRRWCPIRTTSATRLLGKTWTLTWSAAIARCWSTTVSPSTEPALHTARPWGWRVLAGGKSRRTLVQSRRRLAVTAPVRALMPG